MRISYLLCILLLSTTFVWAQVPEGAQYTPASLVENAARQGQVFQPTSFFDLNRQESDVSTHPILSRALHQGTLLSLRQESLNSFVEEAAPSILLEVPTLEGTHTLKLVQVEIMEPGLKVRTSSLGEVDIDPGLHYRGVVDGQTNSIVAISIFENEVMGYFSAPNLSGNYVIGKIVEENTTQHIVYNELDLKSPRGFGCATLPDGEGYDPADLLPQPLSEALTDCVRLYFELDYNVFQNQGSNVQTATNWITGMFNQSITLYANENINMVLSDLFIWTSSSPYSGGSSTMLSQFKSQISSMNGDLGHLVSYISSSAGGIAAGFAGICNSNIDNSLCVTQTNPSYNTVPTYSRSVKVLTHEIGHLLGSRHTHACVWNGNNTAIDGCALATEGSCPVPSIPPGFEGTIMSYCDSRGTAPINFNLGFGPQPGNVIRNSVTNGSCLSPCGGGGNECTSTITSYPYSNNFEANLGWTQGSGDDFDWTRRTGGTPSSGTGPSGASQGSYYAYMEVSSPNYPSKTAYLNSPCFDLSGVTNPEITFDYHMLASPGTLRLDASTDGSSWTTIWSLTGDQGSAWQGATVSLNAYTNETELRLRFNGTSGSTWQGDMCVDDISVDGSGGGGGCNDTEVTLTLVLDNYPSETSWSLTDGGGATVASGGGYSTAGATIVETFCLADDCYEFTINDSYGDGICCAYGNGSYSLDAGSTNLASGGAFGTSETSQIDIGGGCGSTCPQIDFNAYTITAYGGQDAGSSTFQIQDGGATLFLANNSWKYISYPYTVTANTVIEFDFRSTLQGEIHGVAFDNNNSISSNLSFKVHGTQNWGLTNYDNYSGSSWTTYTIPVGTFYTGTFDRLAFISDHDASPSNGNSYFRNVKVYEGSCGGSDNVIAPVGEILIGDEAELDIRVFPNPFRDEVSVFIPYVADEMASVEIYNAVGKMVFQQSRVSTGSQVDLQPDIAAGVYFIRVQVGEMLTNVKLVKTK